MIDYSKSKIYKIESSETDQIYIGSTCRSLKERLHEHKADYKSYLKGNQHYITSFEIVKYADCYITLIEDYPCESKEDLLKREGKLIKRHDNVVNKKIEGRTHQESMKQYYENNKAKIKESMKQYRDNNKDKIKQHNKEYRENPTKIHCACGSTYVFYHKSDHLKTKKHTKYQNNLEADNSSDSSQYNSDSD